MKTILLIIVIVVLLGALLYYSNRHVPQPTQQPPSTTSAVITTAQSQGSCKARYVSATDTQAVLPDPNCTPGTLNTAVSQSTISQTICVSGYTKTIRPPASYTNKLKREQIAEYGYSDTVARDYEEDHFISLELGGNPTNPKNLWPEPHASLNEKDKVEDFLHEQVCNGSLPLSKAQQEITTNWYQVFEQNHL